MSLQSIVQQMFVHLQKQQTFKEFIWQTITFLGQN